MEVNEIITNEEDIKAGMEVAKACISNGFKKGFGINAYLNNIHKRSIFDVGYETANDIIDLLMA